MNKEKYYFNDNFFIHFDVITAYQEDTYYINLKLYSYV